MKTFLLSDKNINKNAYIWNTLSGFSNSLQSMIIMLILTRTLFIEQASYIAIGYAMANLVMTLGKFGVRNFQVTDVSEKYSFSEYKCARFFSMLLMIIVSIVYCIISLAFRSYSIEKMLVVALLCLFKVIETYEDVYHGRLQQIGRLDVASRILTVRNVIYMIELLVLFVLTKNLLLSLTISVFTSIVIFIWFNSIAVNIINVDKSSVIKLKNKNWIRLVIECIPVALATFLLTYIGNSPKYIIDSVVSDEEQACFNIIFMVIFIICLLSTFIFNPILKQMAQWWKDSEYTKLVKRVFILIATVVMLCVVGVIFAELIGRKLLGIVYGVSLEQYRVELILMIIAGGLLAIMNLMHLVIILLRKQIVFYVVFTTVAGCLFFFGKYILLQYQMTGMMYFLISVVAIADVLMLLLSLFIIFNNKKKCSL